MNLPALAQACGGCHGVHGEGYGEFPKISGKSEAEFTRLMSEFRSGRRAASIMNRIAQGYKEVQISALARYFKNR